MDCISEVDAGTFRHTGRQSLDVPEADLGLPVSRKNRQGRRKALNKLMMDGEDDEETDRKNSEAVEEVQEPNREKDGIHGGIHSVLKLVRKFAGSF